MDHNTELLRSVYQSAEMGRDILGRLIHACEDSEFRRFLAEIFAEYHRVLTEAERLLFNQGHIPHPARKAVRVPVYASLSLNLKIDHSSSHIAEMLMQGSLMGFIELTRDLRLCPEAHEESKNLAWRLLASEENNMQRLKQYI